MKKSIMYLFILFFTLFSLHCVPVMVGGLIAKSSSTRKQKQLFLANLNKTNLEREKSGLLPLDVCIAKYQFDQGWALKDNSCKKILNAYIRGEVDIYGKKIVNKKISESKKLEASRSQIP
jgi:hypothetical protein